MKLANAQGTKALFCSEASKVLPGMLTVGTDSKIQQHSTLLAAG